MKIEHVALWTNKLEEMKEFYKEFFNGQANDKYINEKKHFASYFITFQSGARLELMTKPGIMEGKERADQQYTGFVHISFAVESEEEVDALTNKLRERGYEVVSGPRRTGDGYYESCILDPDGNQIEITV